MKQKFAKYNKPDSLILISPYPKKGEVYSANMGGIASFAKNTAINLDKKVIILTNINGTKESYEEKNTLVLKCFKKNTLTSWLTIWQKLQHFKLVKNILIQFDFALYGGIITSSLIIPFLALLKLCGLNAYVVSHSVVLDVFKLSGHLDIKNNLLGKIKGFFLNKVFHLFYYLLGLFAHKIIVTEDILGKKLTKYIKEEKIVVIPHGVDCSLNSIPQEEAKRRLNVKKDEQVVLFFGFVNWFKGADFFIDTFKKTDMILGKKTHFILAGGKSATLKNKNYYNRYYSQALNKISNSKNVKITGFVPQKDIGLYFSAADLVVFPYRYFMSASGVMSLVFSYKKPFIISQSLKEMFFSKDLDQASNFVGLDQNKITFTLDKESCLQTVKRVLENGSKNKMIRMAELIREKRNWQKTAAIYTRVIFTPVYTFKKLPALSYTK